MIVRYARARGYQGDGKDPHLTLGKEYLALGVTFRSDTYPVQVSIQRDSDGTPVLCDLKFFDVVDPGLPDGWGIFSSSPGYYSVEPSEFRGDFWDRFHDGEPDAEKLFTQVVDKVKAFHRI